MKISLIFACYNVSQYLEELYQLLITQPYQDIEIIFVEDYSTDNTKEILRGFTDSRVKIIENSHNQGAAISRNIGITYASGDYIGFPDPDDLFAYNWISEVAKVIDVYNPKIVISGIREDYEIDGTLSYSIDACPSIKGKVSSDNFIDGIIELEKYMIFGNMANKLYLASLLKKNNFLCKKMPLKEDFEFNIQVFSAISEFYILNQPYYFYKKRRNGNSLTSKFVPEYFEIHLNSVLMFKDLLQCKGVLSDSAKSLLVDRFFRYFLSAVERNTNKQANLSFNEQKNWVKTVVESDTRIQWFLEHKNFMRSKLKFLPLLVNSRSYTSIVALGYCIKYIKRYATKFFTKMK